VSYFIYSKNENPFSKKKGFFVANKNLHNAKESKNDEFYTQLEDIEKELSHYRHHFEGKVVFCNCDDPYESNFFKYFVLNFNTLKLKKLIATSYIASPVAFKELPAKKGNSSFEDLLKPYKIEIDEVYDQNGDGAINLQDVKEILEKAEKGGKLTRLTGDGDFRSSESKELLKQADIVVTNPPFSLFREYVAQLIEFDKKFIILGNNNAITYKEIFQLIKNSKMWLGYSANKTMTFRLSNHYKRWNYIDENGNKYGNVPAITWYTNLDIKKRHEELILVKKYSPLDYPKYDNYDAIEVSKVKDIPKDYDGVMGVPITFLDKFNPEQFEIIGLGISSSGLSIGVRGYRPEHKEYRKKVQGRGAVDGDLYMIDKNGHPVVPYARILIKNKKVER
jgi:adenine-specific DNA modification methylase